MTISQDNVNVLTKPLEMPFTFEEREKKERMIMSIRQRKAIRAIESAKIVDNIIKLGLIKAKANAARACVPLYCWKNALAQYRFIKEALQDEKEEHNNRCKKF